jgi:hypothetical protein
MFLVFLLHLLNKKRKTTFQLTWTFQYERLLRKAWRLVGFEKRSDTCTTTALTQDTTALTQDTLCECSCCAQEVQVSLLLIRDEKDQSLWVSQLSRVGYGSKDPLLFFFLSCIFISTLIRRPILFLKKIISLIYWPALTSLLTQE